MTQAATASGLDESVLTQLATELAAAKPSLVLAGGSTADALELARAVNAINQAAGNVGSTVDPAHPLTGFDHAATYADVSALVDRMNRGAVPILFVRGANPVFLDGPGAGLCHRDGQGAFQGELLELSRTEDRRGMRSRAAGPARTLELGVMRPPLPVFARCNSRAWIRVFDVRATARSAHLRSPRTILRVASKYPWPGLPYLAAADSPGRPALRNCADDGGDTGRGDHAAAAPRGARGGEAASTPAARAGAAPARAATPIEQTHRRSAIYVVVYSSPARWAMAGGANKPWLQEMPGPGHQDGLADAHRDPPTNRGGAGRDERLRSHQGVRDGPGHARGTRLRVHGCADRCGGDRHRSWPCRLRALRQGRPGLDPLALLASVQDRGGGSRPDVDQGARHEDG